MTDGSGVSNSYLQYSGIEPNVVNLTATKLDEKARMQNAMSILKTIIESPLLQNKLHDLLASRLVLPDFSLLNIYFV